MGCVHGDSWDKPSCIEQPARAWNRKWPLAVVVNLEVAYIWGYAKYLYAVLKIKKKTIFVRFEVFTVVTMKNGVFWNVTPCGSCKNIRFGGI
jgi:hypothetical protein